MKSFRATPPKQKQKQKTKWMRSCECVWRERMGLCWVKLFEKQTNKQPKTKKRDTQHNTTQHITVGKERSRRRVRSHHSNPKKTKNQKPHTTPKKTSERERVCWRGERQQRAGEKQDPQKREKKERGDEILLWKREKERERVWVCGLWFVVKVESL